MRDYIHMIMTQLASILFNATQRASNVTKDEILDSIKRMLVDYNAIVKGSGNEVQIKDFREQN